MCQRLHFEISLFVTIVFTIITFIVLKPFISVYCTKTNLMTNAKDSVIFP